MPKPAAMRFLPSTTLPEIILIEPDVFRDDRGFFLESFQLAKYRAGGIGGPFVQDNHSRSVRGTVRGLHAQLGAHPQGKLVRVVQGAIFDVAVDIRRGSPTYLRSVTYEISAENFRQVYIPPGFAHGLCVLSEIADVEYKCTDYYDPGSELCVRWDDPTIAIVWPSITPILSNRDRNAPTLAEIEPQFPQVA